MQGHLKGHTLVFFWGGEGGDKGCSRITVLPDMWHTQYHNILDVIYQTRGAVFHRDIQTARRESFG